MRILFYYPTNKRSVSIESLMIAMKKKGDEPIMLSQEQKGDIHIELNKENIETFNYFIKKKNPFIFYLKHFVYLVRFIKKNNVDIVYSHTQVANIVSVFARFFVKPEIIICRHHSYSSFTLNGKIFDLIINLLANKQIAPSSKVLKKMVSEGVSKKNIRQINYGYDFEKYPKPEPSKVMLISQKYKRFKVITIARLVTGKGHFILLEIISKLIAKGVEIDWILLGEGPLENDLKRKVKELNMENYVHFTGFKKNVMDFIEAADMVALLSKSEASNNVIKEAGLRKKVIVVYKDVGDFNEYIEHNKSGILLDMTSSINDQAAVLEKTINNFNQYTSLGSALKNKVIEEFSIQHIVEQYYNW